MNIFVLTRGRDQSMQLTAESLSAAGVEFSFARTAGDTVDVGYQEAKQFFFDAKTGADKRQYLYAQNSRLVMLDDDLKFYRVDRGKPTAASPQDIRELFAYTDALLNEYGLVGLENRLWINSKKQPYIVNPPKIHHFFAINKLLLSGRERFDRFPGHADVDFSLQVLASGARFASITRYCHVDVGQFDRPGGASIWRSRSSDDEQAVRLANQWPGVVKLTDRKGGGLYVTVNARSLKK